MRHYCWSDSLRPIHNRMRLLCRSNQRNHSRLENRCLLKHAHFPFPRLHYLTHNMASILLGLLGCEISEYMVRLSEGLAIHILPSMHRSDMGSTCAFNIRMAGYELIKSPHDADRCNSLILLHPRSNSFLVRLEEDALHRSLL